jgi:restriction system protein
MPSKSSEILAFGYISDDVIYNNFDDIDCDYHKRRKVDWILTERLNELDPIFYKIIFSKHAVSKLNGYAKYIDKVVSNVFIKGEHSHLVLDVTTADNIPVEVLYGMITSVRNLTELINTNFNLGDSLSENAIKLNLQSPGNIEFIYKRGKSLLVLSLILSLPINISCSHPSASLSAESSLEAVIEKNDNIDVVRNNVQGKTDLSDGDKEGINEFFENNYDTIAEAKHQMDILKVKVDKLNSIN